MFLRRANRIHDPGSPLFHGAGSIDRREVGGSGCTDWVLPVPQQDDCGQVGFSQPSGNSWEGRSCISIGFWESRQPWSAVAHGQFGGQRHLKSIIPQRYAGQINLKRQPLPPHPKRFRIAGVSSLLDAKRFPLRPPPRTPRKTSLLTSLRLPEQPSVKIPPNESLEDILPLVHNHPLILPHP